MRKSRKYPNYFGSKRKRYQILEDRKHIPIIRGSIDVCSSCVSEPVCTYI